MTSDDEALVDFHAHFITDDYREAAEAAGYTMPDGMPGWPTWDVDQHLRLMDQWGVSTSMLSISSPGVRFGDDAATRVVARTANEFGAEIARKHGGRFGHFASLTLPDVEGSLLEAAHALDELGSDGLAIETSSDGVYLGDARYEPLWAELNRRRALVFVHPTSPLGHETVALGRPRPMLEFIFDSTRTVSDLVFSGVLRRYPDIDWLFTHTGGTLPLLVDRLELFRTTFLGGSLDDPTALDEIRGLWFDMAGTPFPRSVPALISAFGSERLLYGSDYCWTPAGGVAEQIASIDGAHRPDGDTWRGVTTRNARRLIPRLGLEPARD